MVASVPMAFLSIKVISSVSVIGFGGVVTPLANIISSFFGVNFFPI
jgi:hypothetical protein